MHSSAMRTKKLALVVFATTQDHALHHLLVTVHYSALSQQAFDAFYAMATRRLEALTTDVLHTSVARLTDTEVIVHTDKLAAQVLSDLGVVSRHLGCGIVDVDITRVCEPTCEPQRGTTHPMDTADSMAVSGPAGTCGS